jgi:ribonucleoside-triphosphate reductase
MIEKILKRDGTYKEFHAYKIEDAIKKAFRRGYYLYKFYTDS